MEINFIQLRVYKLAICEVLQIRQHMVTCICKSAQIGKRFRLNLWVITLVELRTLVTAAKTKTSISLTVKL